MSEELPRFTYHPNPVATHSVEASDKTCVCCGRARGFIYPGPAYAIEELFEALCPWCIADGSAAAKFDAGFVQDSEESLPADAHAELFGRTPGYSSWQGERWLCHCTDACEFHGDLSRKDLDELTREDEARFLAENPWIEKSWPRIRQNYTPKGELALYKFVCRHCGVLRLGVDMS